MFSDPLLTHREDSSWGNMCQEVLRGLSRYYPNLLWFWSSSHQMWHSVCDILSQQHEQMNTRSHLFWSHSLYILYTNPSEIPLLPSQWPFRYQTIWPQTIVLTFLPINDPLLLPWVLFRNMYFVSSDYSRLTPFDGLVQCVQDWYLMLSLPSRLPMHQLSREDFNIYKKVCHLSSWLATIFTFIFIYRTYHFLK